MVPVELLIEYGAREISVGKNDSIFLETERAQNYFQVLSGEVKMNNFSEGGKEFIQSIFSKGRSFGEPPLFGDFNYPANAVAIKPSVILCLSKKNFFQLLTDHSAIHLKFTETLSQRLYYKSLMAAEMSSQEAGRRILVLIDYLKTAIYKIEERHGYEVELTRQQIADLTGLRVETVIRALKKLETNKEIKIVQRKVWR